MTPQSLGSLSVRQPEHAFEEVLLQPRTKGQADPLGRFELVGILHHPTSVSISGPRPIRPSTTEMRGLVLGRDRQLSRVQPAVWPWAPITQAVNGKALVRVRATAATVI